MRGAGPLLLTCALLAALPAAGVRAAIRVHGIEADATETQDRLLVFADGDLSWRLERDDSRTTHLVIRDALLDASVPRRVVARSGSAWTLATVTDKTDGIPEVRITVRHAPGAAGKVSERGTQLAYAFERRGPPRPSARKPDRKPPEATLRVRQLNADLRDMIVRLARFVDMKIFFDESLSGRVSIDAPEPITRSEAVALIDALLLLKGFAALPTPGGVHKIVPIAGAQGAFVPELPDDPGGVPVTTIVMLEEIDAELVEQAIRPLIGDSSVLIQHPSANGLILAGPGHRLRRLIEIVRELDELGPRRMVILNLRHADALVTAAALDEAFEGRQLEVWPDVRTNRLVVRGRPDRIGEVRAFVTRLDRPALGHGGLQVMPVQYGDAARLADLLNSLRIFEPTPGSTSASGRGARSLAGREFGVSVHAPTRSLVVRADAQTMELVREVLSELDQEPARIEVEILIAEVSLDHSLALGFDSILPVIEPRAIDDLAAIIIANPTASISGSNPLLGTPDASLFAKISRRPLLIPVVDPATGQIVNVSVPLDSTAVTADDRTVRTQVLLRPRLSLLSGEVHEIFSGDNVPIRIAETGATNALQTRQSIERRDVGLRLRVEPSIGAEDGVLLKLDLEVSRLTPSLAQDASVVGPTIRERSIESTIHLQSGHSGVVGFALTPTTTRVEAGTPFFKNIPVLGFLFRSTRTVELDNTLLMIVRAEVHRPEAEALSEWLRLKLAEPAPELAEAPHRPPAPSER